MESEMTHWNDDRLDELNERVKDGFAKAATREEMGEVKAELHRVNNRLDQFGVRLDRVLNTLLAAALGFGGTALVAVLGLIASHL